MDELEDRLGTPVDHFESASEIDDQDDDLEYECTDCGHEYTGSAPCPECGAFRRRYIGLLPGEDSHDQEEVATDGGAREADLVDRAVREATTLVEAGDSVYVAISYVVDEHELDHRRDDVLKRVRDRLDQKVATDGGRDHRGREAFLAGEVHWCDICQQAFDSIDELANHDCRQVRTDGGQEIGDRRPDETVELRIRTDRANLAGIMSTYTIGVEYAPTFGPGEEILEDVAKGMDDVYPAEHRINDLLRWGKDGSHAASPGVDVELVELEGDLVSEFDSDPDDRDPTAIPIADGGRSVHRATCEDCAWSYCDEDLVDVSDEMERHARKEMHDVDLERAVATDGGTSSGGTYRSNYSLNRLPTSAIATEIVISPPTKASSANCGITAANAVICIAKAIKIRSFWRASRFPMLSYRYYSDQVSSLSRRRNRSLQPGTDQMLSHSENSTRNNGGDGR